MFFYNLKVAAATAATSINRIRVRDESATTELIYHMLAAPGGVRVFQPTPSHTHTYTHTHTHTHTHTRTHAQVFKENFEKICYKSIPLCGFFYFKFRCKASESLKLLIPPP